MVPRSIYTKRLLSSRLLLLFILIAALASCNGNNDNPQSYNMRDFLKRESYGLFGYGGYLLRYNEKDYQISVNKQRKQIRLQHDNQQSYLNVVFLRIPKSADEPVSLNFIYKGGGDEVSSTVEMLFCKESDDAIWLWSESEKLGLILPKV